MNDKQKALLMLTKEWQNVALYEWNHSSGAKCTFYVDAKLSTDQSIIENKSLVDIRLRSVLGAYSTLSGSGYKFTCTNCPTIEGSGNSVWNFETEVITSSANKEIIHEDDGTKELSITATLYNSYLGLNQTISATVQLPTIARKSTISCSSPFNIRDNVTLNINSKNASFTHTIRYNFENVGERVIAENVTGETSIPYPWATPETMYTDGEMESKTSGNGYLTVETFVNDTSIGVSEQFPFTANVTNSNPTVDATIVDTNSYVVNNLTGNANILVKGLSNAKITATANTKNGATLSTYRVVNGNQSSTTYPEDTINKIESDTFTFYVTDSRGNNNGVNGTQKKVTFKDYFPPYATTLEVRRTEQTSTEIIANLRGKWWNGNFGKVNNDLQYSYRIKESSTTTWGAWSTVTRPTISDENFSVTNLSLGTAFDTGKDYDIQFRLNDVGGTYILNNIQQVTKSIGIIDIYEDEVAIFGDGYIQNNLIVGNIKEKNLFDDRYWGFVNHEAKMTTSTYFNNFMIVKNNFLDKFEVGKTYTVSFECMETDGEYWFSCVRYYTDDTYEENYDTYSVGKYSYKFTVNKDLSYIGLRFNRTSNIGVTKNSTIKNIQIEEGERDTDFTPAISNGYISGSNENGEWVKYDDGTMICRNNVILNNLTFAKPTSSSIIAQTAGGNNLGDYAQTFVELPKLFVDCITSPFMKPLDVYNRSNSHVGNCYLWTWNELSGASGTITYLAIGRWK